MSSISIINQARIPDKHIRLAIKKVLTIIKRSPEIESVYVKVSREARTYFVEVKFRLLGEEFHKTYKHRNYFKLYVIVSDEVLDTLKKIEEGAFVFS